MEPFAERTARLVGRHPSAALPLHEVRHLLRRDAPGPPPDEEYLLSALRRRPDLFRILDPWQGAWRSITEEWPQDGAAYLPYLREIGISPRWPWVVGFTTETEGWPSAGHASETALARLRESLVTLSRDVDDASVPAITRWCRLMGEHRSLLAQMEGRKS